MPGGKRFDSIVIAYDDGVVDRFGKCFGYCFHPIRELLCIDVVALMLTPVVSERLMSVVFRFWSPFKDTVAIRVQVNFAALDSVCVAFQDEILVNLNRHCCNVAKSQVCWLALFSRPRCMLAGNERARV